METKINPITKLTVNLAFGDEIVELPIKPVSYASVSAVLSAQNDMIKSLSFLDSKYKPAYEIYMEEEALEEKYRIVDPVLHTEKSMYVKLAGIRNACDACKAIVQTKNLTTEQKEMMLRDEFWDFQDIENEIIPAVSYFRLRAEI